MARHTSVMLGWSWAGLGQLVILTSVIGDMCSGEQNIDVKFSTKQSSTVECCALQISIVKCTTNHIILVKFSKEKQGVSKKKPLVPLLVVLKVIF